MIVINGKEYDGYATSYAIKAWELYSKFPTTKYLKRALKAIPKKYYNNYPELYGQIFKYFFFLMIQDIIENNISFKFPHSDSYIEMQAVHGDDFKRAREAGAFPDVDYLASNFTGYNIAFRRNGRWGSRSKRLHISRRFTDRITELTNQGKKW